MAHAGQILKNPLSGQDPVFRRTSDETDGEPVEVESVWKRRGAEPPEHYHPSQEERFEVTAAA